MGPWLIMHGTLANKITLNFCAFFSCVNNKQAAHGSQTNNVINWFMWTRFGAWPHWNNFHDPSYLLHSHHLLGSKPYYSSTADADAFLRTRAQYTARATSSTPASTLQRCLSYQNDQFTNHHQRRLPRNEDNIHHDPIDLDLALDVGPRRDKKIKISGFCWGRDQEEENDGDQEVQSATDDTRLSLSLFPSPPCVRTSSGGHHKVLGINMEKGKAHPTRTSTLDLTI
jgi:hypothetical protein